MKKIFAILIFTAITAFAYGQTIIQMEKEDGVYFIPCTVNGLKLKFIFDTGANDVSISLSEALFMLKNDYLDEEDLIGSEYYQIANGDIEEGTKIILKKLEIGNKTLYNVEASIVHSISAPLLLGQSALQKFGKFSVDYSANTLTLGAESNEDALLKAEADRKLEQDIEDSFASVEEVNINNLYNVEIPSSLSKTYDLNDEASLQYENVDEDVYLIVLDENKKEVKNAVNELLEDEELIDIYAYLQFTTFATDYDFKNYLKKSIINGLKARQLDVVNHLDEHDVFYKMSCYEGKTNLYFLVTWTTLENKDRLNPVLQNIINSFKEI